MRRRILPCLVVLGLFSIAATCKRAPPSPHTSLLIVTVDTLRADRLGCYGRTTARTPAADRLAAEGTRFETAITPLPRTTPSIATILTGLTPPSHRVRGLWSTLPSDIPTLAVWLRAHGRRTGAFASNLFLRPGSGFGAGFEVYSNPRSRWAGNSAKQVTDEALEWMAGVGGEQPFFLWVHYLDPHWTYDPPSPFDTLYDPGFKGPWPYTQIAAGDRGQGKIIFQNTMTPAEVRHAIALYEGEIAATDVQVGRLIQSLSDAKRLDRTLVVFTSDHGESLGEHDYFFDHGEYLYEGTLLVPLILRWPGVVPAGKVVTSMARLEDIAPTALALLGEPLPSGIEGRSLVDDMKGSAAAAGSEAKGSAAAAGSDVRGSATAAGSDVAAAPGAGGPPERVAWIESDHSYVRKENPRHFVNGIAGKWRALRGERYKLIFVPHDAAGTTGDVELYDLKQDPWETHDLSKENRDLASRLLDRLRSHWEKTGAASAPASEGAPPDAELLRSLGYL